MMTSSISVLQLEQRRRKSGVSLETIADSTKISSRFLRAIECEEFEKLPGGVFNTSYIRQYAESIGFPVQDLLAQYKLRMEPEPEVDIRLAEHQTSVWRGCLNWFRSAATLERT
jgi:cytoskeletal protein RodZ